MSEKEGGSHIIDESIEMKDVDSFSNSAEGSSDDDDADENKVLELQKQIEGSPYTYDLHVQLISLCRRAGDLDKLRDAREQMSKLFPLSPELWLDWLIDEKKYASSKEQKDKINDLFERALKDYSSVSIWLEYVQFSIGSVSESWEEKSLDVVRRTFERALTSVGIHVGQGCLIWEAYREFEAVYLMNLKNQSASSDDITKQENRICTLFKRQLSIPLFDMDKTYAEYKELYKESFCNDKAALEYKYKKALQKLKILQGFEESIDASESPHYEEYKKYIEHEKQEREPIRVQHIFERALIENCLKAELWIDYLKYLDEVVKIKEISLGVYERAIRNCPWSVQIWVYYGRALERFQEPLEKVTGIFETALEMGFTKSEDFKELWLAYIDYLRRLAAIELEDTGEKDFKKITDVFERALTQMNSYFHGSDSEYSVMKYWIFFSAKYLKDMEGARKTWKDVMDHGNKDSAQAWLDYASFERRFGDSSRYRKCLFQAISSASDWQETFVDMLINFEREEGTLDSLEKTIAKCDTQMKIINQKRLKKLEASSSSNTENRKNASLKHSVKNRQESPNKNSRSPERSEVKMDSEGFKIPPVPDKVVHSPEIKQEPPSSPEQDRKRKDDSSREDENQPESKKRKVEISESHGSSIKHDPTKDERTVFLSNLSYNTDEAKIKEYFSKVGEVEEVRLVKDYKGRSKGFSYVVYKSELDAKSALSEDRSLLDGRPVLVSPCEDRKSGPSPQNKFKFGTGLERKKLFVKGLPFTSTKDDLAKLFEEYGKIKEVRLVTYRNGHSKGLAYIEYEEEASASNAVMKMDGTNVEEHLISVAISNPPPRKPKKDFSSVSVFESLGGGGSSKGPRGRGRTQVTLLPRSLARPSGSKRQPDKSLQNGQNSASTSQVTKPLSNSDFANMLKK